MIKIREQSNTENVLKLLDFLKEKRQKGEKINDDDFHTFAEDELKMNVHEAEASMYNVLADILGGGKSEGKEFDYDKKELEMGMKVEKEHTDNDYITKKIAMDHLKEIPDYYTRLKKMEDEASKKEKIIRRSK